VSKWFVKAKENPPRVNVTGNPGQTASFALEKLSWNRLIFNQAMSPSSPTVDNNQTSRMCQLY
jgi:hypothetical protein